MAVRLIRPPRIRPLPSLGGALAIAAVLLIHQARAAEPPTGAGAFDEHLAAGEFAVARNLAAKAATPAERDARWSRLAAAQAQAGARAAAVRSAAEMTDDRTRATVLAQVGNFFGGNNRGGNNRGGNNFGQAVFGDPEFDPNDSGGGQGGAAEPDFDSLIELIESTIAPQTWDGVGGPGAIDSFEGGVFVDAHGVLQPIIKTESGSQLAALRLKVATTDSGPAQDKQGVRKTSRLRAVSLNRLERAVHLRLAAGEPLDDAMRYLAGLQRIQYVFVHPESGDVIIAGPASDWRASREGRVVGVESGSPVLRLDDLVVVLRQMREAGARFGCSITPTAEGLARTKAYLAESGKSSLPAGKREAWLTTLRQKLGQQDVDVYGIEPRSRVARVLVEADYRMKLVGMGLEEGVLGVTSYLDSVKVAAGEAPPPMDVLRWWFTLNYKAVLASKDRAAFEIRGQGVQVLSENELLTAQGKRVHTGKSDELNAQFAQSFTERFPALAEKYPVYAELRNIFDLALVGALVESEGLADRAGWHMTCFGDPKVYRIEMGPAATHVDSVINHRVINKRHIVAGISGGVRVDPAPLVERQSIEIDTYGVLSTEYKNSVRQLPARDVWWWDP